jgi:hypothetical protein
VSRRRATLIQEDIARVIRAAKQAGAAEVEIRVNDGARIVVRITSSTATDIVLAQEPDIVL